MPSLSHLVLGAAVAVSFVAPVAVAQVSVIYDASVGTDPAAQGWTLAGQLPYTFSVAGGILSQDTTPFSVVGCLSAPGSSSQPQSLSWSGGSTPFDFSDGCVVEAEVRVISSQYGINPCTSYPRAGFRLGVVDATGSTYLVGLGDSMVYLSNDGFVPFGSPGVVEAAFNTTGSFHTYRLEILGSSAVLLIDGAQVLSLSTSGNPSTPNRILVGDSTSWANSQVDIRGFSATSGCQPNLGFQGPGSVGATLCGTGLNAGESADYEVTGAEANAPGALLLSAPNLANVTLFPLANPGVLVSGAGLALAVPIVADGSGNLGFPVPGVGTPGDLVFQSLFADSGVLPHNVAFTNAILAQFGQ